MAVILVIDDNEALRAVMRRSLEADRHEVVEAADGRAGLALVTAREPALMIADILMPVQDGLETIRSVRALRPAMPIVAISSGGSFDRMDLLAVAREFGADAVLRKPFRPRELRAQVDRLLRSSA